MLVLLEPDLIDRSPLGNPSPVGRRRELRGSAVTRGAVLDGTVVHGDVDAGG